jgi:hypothetical protein
MNMLGKTQPRVFRKNEAILRQKMASFPVKMGLFWAFSNLGKRPPRKSGKPSRAGGKTGLEIGDWKSLT